VGALLTRHGLYSPAMVIIGFAVAGLAFLYTWRHLCLVLLRYPVGEQAVSWRSEVWPFQWKIAVSWACTYFTHPDFHSGANSLTADQRRPVSSDCPSVSPLISSALVIAWMSTKAASFGQMIARGELQQLKGLFFRTLRQSLVVLVGISAACEASVLALHYLFPRLAARMASPQVFALPAAHLPECLHRAKHGYLPALFQARTVSHPVRGCCRADGFAVARNGERLGARGHHYKLFAVYGGHWADSRFDDFPFLAHGRRGKF